MKNPYEYKSGKYLDINLGGEATRLHPKNTHIFTHTLQPEGNHIYIMHRPLDDDNIEATYLWRKKFMDQNDPGRFDRLSAKIAEIGCEVHEAVFMNEGDSERYFATFGQYALAQTVEHPLTQRHENLIQNLGRTLRVMPTKDLIAEMQLPNDFRPYPSRWI